MPRGVPRDKQPALSEIRGYFKEVSADDDNAIDSLPTMESFSNYYKLLKKHEVTELSELVNSARTSEQIRKDIVQFIKDNKLSWEFIAKRSDNEGRDYDCTLRFKYSKTLTIESQAA